jgi:acetyl esterase/lipase
VGKVVLSLYPLLVWAISLMGVVLSLWIVLPAPVASLLPLSVGAPEVSLWLLVLNGVAIGLVLSLRPVGLGYVALAASAIALTLSLLPLSQFLAANQAAQQAMVRAFGSDYDQVSGTGRSHPLSLTDAFRGIPATPVRHLAGVPVAKPDGVPLTLDIYQPPEPGTYPAIVIIHGGGWQGGSPEDNAAFSRYMAAQGYVVWAITYRYAPAFHFPAQFEDVKTALAFLQQHAQEYDTDPTRIALLGRSAGSQLAMLAGYYPDALPIQAVVGYYGPINLVNGYYDLPSPDPLDVRSVLENFLGGTPEQVRDRYEAASPSQYVRANLPPSLLIYGGKDRIVLSRFGRGMAEALTAQGNKAVFIEIPWADHAFDAVFNGISNQLALYYTERFFAWALRPK